MQSRKRKDCKGKSENLEESRKNENPKPYEILRFD